MFHMLLASPWFNILPSLENLWQTGAARDELANLQPTWNKWAGRAGLTIFVTDCLQN